MIDYRLALADRSSTGLGTVIMPDVLGTVGVPQQNGELLWSEELNEPGDLEFTIPIDHAAVTRDNFGPGRREVHLYRNDVLVWGGKIWGYRIRGWYATFECHGWWFDMDRRIMNADYSGFDLDQFTIVRAVVDYTQALADGNLGITHFDSSLSGVTRRLIVCIEEQRSISDIVGDLSEGDDGFDFAVSPDKVLRLWSPRRGSAVTAMFGDENLSTFEYDEDATDLVNSVTAIGPPDEADELEDETNDCVLPIIYQASDPAVRAIYGRLEGTLSTDSDWDTAHREAKAEEELRTSKKPRFQPTVFLATDLQEVSAPDDVSYEDVGIGDIISVDVNRGPAGTLGNFIQEFRVVKRSVQVTRPGMEVIRYGLDQVID